MKIKVDQLRLKVDQLRLFVAMVNEINKQHGGELAANPDLFNACIANANLCRDKVNGLDIAVCLPENN